MVKENEHVSLCKVTLSSHHNFYENNHIGNQLFSFRCNPLSPISCKTGRSNRSPNAKVANIHKL